YGGVEPYSYNWAHGANTKNVESLTAGNYSVEVVDGNGCSINLSGTVRTNTIYINAVSQNISCKGAQDVTIDASVSNGTAPYTYKWAHGATTSSLTDLAPGYYTLTASDAAGCSTTRSFYISEPKAITVSYDIKEDCNSGDGLFVDLTISGGSAPYVYSWSDGQSTQDVSVATEGDYLVSVTDSKGCSIEEYISVYKYFASPFACSINQPVSQPVEGSENILNSSANGAV